MQTIISEIIQFMNSTTQKVLQLLNSNNIKTSTIEGAEKYHKFSVSVEGYDDITLNSYFVEDEDDDIITFCTPGIYDYNNEEFVAVIDALNEMSVHSLFVRSMIIGKNSVWLYIEYKLFNREITIDMLQFMISTLVSFGLNLLNKIDECKARHSLPVQLP